MCLVGPALSRVDGMLSEQDLHFIDQQHQRFGIGFSPNGERLQQRTDAARGLQRRRPYVSQRPVAQRPFGLHRQPVQNRPHCRVHVFARGLPDLHVHVYAAVFAAGVQLVPQRQQCRGLTRLARRVQHEIAPLPDQAQHPVEVDPLQRCDVVVALRLDGPLGTEEAVRRPI